MQALIEENAFEPTFDEVDCHIASNGSTPSATPTKILVKSLNLGNMTALERRIRKELEEQGEKFFDRDCFKWWVFFNQRFPLGLLDFDESEFVADTDLKTEPEVCFQFLDFDFVVIFCFHNYFQDEVTAELRQRQKELDLLQKNNFDKLQSLIAKCEATIERQNLEERLKIADDHVIMVFFRKLRKKFVLTLVG